MLVPFIALLTSGCIVAVDDQFCVDEPVDEIVIDVSHGNVKVSADRDLCVEVDVGGVASAEFRHRVKNGVLSLDYECTACGGDIVVTAPQGILVDVAMGSGDLELVGRGGDVFAAVGAGEITAMKMVSRWTELATGAGSVDATWDSKPEFVSALVAAGGIVLTVPAGEYNLDLETDVGAIDVSGIEESSSAESQITAITSTGRIKIRGK